jgi:hypothetical protein
MTHQLRVGGGPAGTWGGGKASRLNHMIKVYEPSEGQGEGSVSCSPGHPTAKASNLQPINLSVNTGARPIIRNPEKRKLLTLLGSFTLTSSIIPVDQMTSTLLIILFFASYYRTGTCK